MSTLVDAPAPAPLSDADARRCIEEALDETLFVEAGAGSGKTTTLVRRIVALVAGGTPVGAIAAITFTEKAATELRDRVRQALAARATDAARAVAGDARRFRRALDELDGAAIGTLHAFAQRILREHPIEAGLPPAVEVLDEIGSQIAFEARWRAMRDELFADPSRSRSLLLADAAGARPQAFADVAAAFDDNWDLIDTHVPAMAPAPPPVDARDLVAAGRVIVAHRRSARATDSLTDRLDALEVWCDEVDDAGDDEGAVLELLDVEAGPVKRWKGGQRGRKQNWPAGRQDEVRAELAELAAQVERRRHTVLHLAVDHLVAALGTFTLQSADERRRRGRLEFHDLLVLARDLLRRHPGARQALHDRYRRVLVDEFQDTDPIQVELAVRLTTPPLAEGPWAELSVVPGRLFVVGDPKQSIYRFRRADLATFLTARDALVRTPTTLDANFRTVAPVIDWVNHVFGRLIRPEPSVQPAFHPLHATRPALAVGPPVTLIGVNAVDDDASADERRRREATDVAAAVSAALAEGWTVTAPDGRPRPAVLGDIAILMPARTSLAALEQALEAADIPYRAESSSLVYATAEVRALLLALRAIDDPSDELALVQTLRSPLYGCSDPDLFRWHQRAGRWRIGAPPLPPIADDPVSDAMASLAALAADRHWLGPSELLDRLVRERRVLELGFVTGHPRDLWRRVRFVVDQARAWAEAGGRGLRAYLEWAYRQAAEGGVARAAEVVLPETDDDAVRIMTVHAAKGLEFPITVVTGLTTQPSRPRPGAQVLWHGERVEVKVGRAVTTQRYEESKALDEQLSHHERLRLLYVACTRARDHLVVSLHRPRNLSEADAHAGTKATSAELLAWACAGAPHQHELAGGEGAAVSPPAPAPAAPWPWADEAAWRAERDRALAAAHRPGTVAATTVAEAAADDPGLAVRSALSADDAGPGARPGSPGGDGRAAGAPGTRAPPDPGLAKDGRDLELPPWLKGRYGTAVGRAVHAVLQTVDLTTGAGLAEAAAAQAAAEGILGRERLVAGLARSALAAPSVREAAALPHWRELYVATRVGDTILEGYIDLLYRSALGLVVVDHKTDQADTDEALERRVARYRPQGAAYALAVQQVTGEPVARVVFVFCSPRGAAAEREITDLAAAKAEVVAAVSAPGGLPGRAPPG